jgi:hypothetical protein
MDDILAKLLIEGGSLAIFVIFVLYLTRGQAVERTAMMKMVTDATDKRDIANNATITSGYASLDKVNGSIKDLVAVNVELSKIMAVHDATSIAGRAVALSKLDEISAQLKKERA